MKSLREWVDLEKEENRIKNKEEIVETGIGKKGEKEQNFGKAKKETQGEEEERRKKEKKIKKEEVRKDETEKRRNLLFWNVAGLGNNEKEFWKFVKEFDFQVLVRHRWRKRDGIIKDRLPKTYE